MKIFFLRINVSRAAVIKQVKFIGLFFSLLVLSQQAFSQFDLPDPDAPPGVPFDDHLHIILMIAGIVFALVILTRWFRSLPKAD